jgi:hypothetical protein
VSGLANFGNSLLFVIMSERGKLKGKGKDLLCLLGNILPPG